MNSLNTAQVHADLFSWVSTRLRPLPWRNVRDPWKILVSEVMLQQTSVHRVLPKWQMFIEAFPTPDACARAPLGEVLRMWHGLGYPRRARNLHDASKVIVDRFAGSVPSSIEDLMSLTGIGPYTARAVVAFAYEGDAAVVDVNVARVLRRLSGIGLAPRDLQGLADEILPDGEAWLWNQALMDLGSMVCRPRPQCSLCPLESTCVWRGHGPDPAARSSKAKQAAFEGSDRQARGRLLKHLMERSASIEDASKIMGRPTEIAATLVSALLDEGLIRRNGDDLTL